MLYYYHRNSEFSGEETRMRPWRSLCHDAVQASNHGAQLYYALLWEGYHESRRCSRDIYPESYITKYSSIRRSDPMVYPNEAVGGVFGVARPEVGRRYRNLRSPEEINWCNFQYPKVVFFAQMQFIGGRDPNEAVDRVLGVARPEVGRRHPCTVHLPRHPAHCAFLRAARWTSG